MMTKYVKHEISWKVLVIDQIGYHNRILRTKIHKYTSFQKNPSNIKATVSIFLSKSGRFWLIVNVLDIFGMIMREYDIQNKMQNAVKPLVFMIQAFWIYLHDGEDVLYHSLITEQVYNPNSWLPIQFTVKKQGRKRSKCTEKSCFSVNFITVMDASFKNG